MTDTPAGTATSRDERSRGVEVEKGIRLLMPSDDTRSSLAWKPAASNGSGPLAARLKRLVFGIDPADTSFSRRGFSGSDASVRERLEEVGHCFVRGYHAAIEESTLEGLSRRLSAERLEWHGFAYEGAAMGLTVLDTVTPWRRTRLARFLAGPADPHVYIAHVGAGWALARLPLSPRKLLSRLSPFLRWLALDGYGFHEGFFNWPRSVVRQEVPRRLQGYARRGFDQGLGRSLWFVKGADVEAIPKTIGSFPAPRRSDLWAGLGLACAYAGGRSEGEIVRLTGSAADYLPALAQGVGFATAARERAGNLAAHTELACQVVWGLGAAEVTAATLAARPDLPPDGVDAEVPAFEVWRRQIQETFSQRRAQ